MTDIEKRAHDLAVAYTHAEKIREDMKNECPTTCSSEVDFASSYSDAYDFFLVMLNDSAE